ncbi:HAMP domain-containing histidine kinase [Ramlibacter sp. RBP-2]|uniref:histidine kinase n=1 Tax=Ramlibacter lithotrophicus TaxID=2606681 RepID=A0A7X6DIE2_9BURK|nr:HAMP domain-containing sensor histidine kinase [Ramlibacter lithotrophicus]NKE67732.1 HAMP domain-containing histidine kinase [Ramlibacter lithotrophicus]
MHEFLIHNRAELIERCKAKVALRPLRSATPEQLKNGIPLFLEQLIRTLQAESEGESGESIRISGASGGGSSSTVSEMGLTATAHGKRLLELGYSVDQVVHAYGDLCQAITDTAVERDAPFTVDEFRTLNRCLDNAIAEAVTEFSVQRDLATARRYSEESNERHGFLLHELRNSLHTASLALTALETGKLPIAGATGAVLRRSLVALTSLVKHALDEVRVAAALSDDKEVFSLASFVADAGSAALLDANARGCSFIVRNTIDPDIEVEGERELLLGAVMNLVQNAFKFTRPGTEVSLNAHATSDGIVSIDVEDRCGGLPPGVAEMIFRPFTRRHGDKSGLGLGLSIARQNVEAVGGTLTVSDLPGKGCVFTITLHRHKHHFAAEAPGK